MEKKYKGIYSECVELSKLSTRESLKKLFLFYIKGNKDYQKTAKQALRKTKSKKIVFELLEEYLIKTENPKDIFLLLNLGMSLFRYQYIKRYLTYFKENNIELKSIGFYKGISNNPLSDREKDEIAQYIIELEDFDLRLFSLVGENNKEKVLDALLDSIALNGIDENTLKILESNVEYIELLQEDIYLAIKQNPYTNLSLTKYLDYSLTIHQSLLAQYQDLFLIYSILSQNIFKDKILYAEDFNIKISLQIIRKQQIDITDWELLQKIVLKKAGDIIDIEDSENVLNFILATVYFNKLFAENILIDLYKKTKLYSNRALIELSNIKSQYAYREMLSFMLTSEDRKERYKYAVKLMMSYPENSATIYAYATDLNDEKLLQTLDDIAEKYKIQPLFRNKYSKVALNTYEKVQILPHGTIISEFLLDLAKEIKATHFYTAVGFIFSSGLRMLYPLLNYIHNIGGTLELITGSLQNFETKRNNTKIDRGTVQFLNNLIDKFDFKLFTYTFAFYHGKFYYLSNDKIAYIVIGSSNISKTAFLGNYELNTLITVKLSEEKNQFIQWYEEFQNQCETISHLDEKNYEELKWESELDIYSSRYVHRLSYEEINRRISALTDEETRIRLNIWLSHNPSEIFSNLGIASLQDYIVFLYAEHGLAIFESFIAGNAYYTFKYFDFDELLKNVSTLSKSQMILSSSFVNRGYHISDKDKLESRIDRLFIS
ncbi:phospholipase D family protein [Hungatella effluvii]|uniref:phospholipase D family protein n=1 Tax=Hungatella effluvii TaxID=1096246 RepID=UPI002A818E88|nr:phospholipase D family protein [Hungatella effluvii]